MLTLTWVNVVCQMRYVIGHKHTMSLLANYCTKRCQIVRNRAVYAGKLLATPIWYVSYMYLWWCSICPLLKFASWILSFHCILFAFLSTKFEFPTEWITMVKEGLTNSSIWAMRKVKLNSASSSHIWYVPKLYGTYDVWAPCASHKVRNPFRP